MSESDWDLLLKYCHETGFTITMEELKMLPRHIYVWGWWRAMSYYRINNHYHSIDEAPPGLPWVGVVDDELSREYKWEYGRYVMFQQMTRKEAKSIYGE